MNFKNMTVYQIYPRSFYDSNGDGIGDLKGIEQKLDYIKELGVDMIWITPFFKSHQYDNGYDVDDYCSVDPRFGSMEDFDNLIKKADSYGIGIMLDMVFNHSSIHHEWFQKALAGDKKYQDYYFFKSAKNNNLPTNWISKFGGPTWEYVESLDKYYLHLFHKGQADLNWENEELRDELVNVLKFWKNKGVKGFRFDVVNLISKPKIFEDDFQGDGRRFYTDGPKVNEYLQEIVYKAGIENMITVGEMSSTSIANCIEYTKPENKELNMAFNFHHLKVDYKDGEKWELAPVNYKSLKEIFSTWQVEMQNRGGWSAWFWNNHDQPRAVSRFTNDKEYRVQSAKLLANIIHLFRGTPYIFQGEEFGMTNGYFESIEEFRDYESINYYNILLEKGKSKEEALNILSRRSRDNGRIPIHWDDTENSGFTRGTPWIKINENYLEINAKKDRESSNSIFKHYQKLISLRRNLKLISHGNYREINTDIDKLFIFERYLDNEELICINNFSNEELIYEFNNNIFEKYKNSKILISNYGDKTFTNPLVLKPYESIAYINSEKED
ncbi:alpha,alpha-phosphotrehalase [Miniphocaeibacter halophilus]|uniref:Alpha,alpha-phosphotrehalase n=1 Tax=Miniphocaeibacter halophilus TaxID=2931922 RepID=A0AC61MW29_9FIRM|nr:alpha,alpha-phosphotrehalase [Miniphocaeibacter halophilus]QQK08699.1 alpha,alpha-phosphotrehalase [Miniphocaeibacter halophilus]